MRRRSRNRPTPELTTLPTVCPNAMTPMAQTGLTKSVTTPASSADGGEQRLHDDGRLAVLEREEHAVAEQVETERDEPEDHDDEDAGRDLDGPRVDSRVEQRHDRVGEHDDAAMIGTLATSGIVRPVRKSR